MCRMLLESFSDRDRDEIRKSMQSSPYSKIKVQSSFNKGFVEVHTKDRCIKGADMVARDAGWK